ncbi:MAG: type IV pilus assembly protein PilM [Patescibacteria group bacterium]|jgi:type IV pilus assembly protein PilM
MLGLDISDRMLRLVALKKKRGGISIESANEIAVPPGIINEGEISKPELLHPIISTLIQTAKPKKDHSKKIVACLPERKSFIKVLNLSTDSEITDDTINTELANHIPEDLNTMYLDWKKIYSSSENESVLVGAVPKSIVESYQEVINKANLVPYVLEIESAAIVRSIIPEVSENQNEGILVIDIGLDRTSFIIYDHGTIQFTSAVPEISGNLMTSLIMKSLSLSYDKAEKAKKLGGLSKTIGKGAVAKVLNDQLTSLIEKIKQVVEYYQEHHSDQSRISNIILTGGGANLIDIENQLFLKLKIKVSKANSFLKIAKNNTDLITAKNQSSFATAIGLALRAQEYDKS